MARETARATEDNGQKIEAIQRDSKGAVEAIGQIGGIITQINDIQTTIACAVEEQTATTTEVHGNVARTASGACEISRGIGEVAAIAATASAGAQTGGVTVEQMRRAASELDSVVNRFKI